MTNLEFNEMDTIISLRDVNKTYPGVVPLHVLKDINLEIQRGELVSIMGASGSGKSTLLNILGILDSYDSGDYVLDGVPIFYQGVSRKTRNAMAMEQLERLGLADRATHLPGELSGGQKQRVAIARALVTNPSLILADEPTGALDSHTSKEVMQIFRDLNAEGMTTVIVTHDPNVGAATNRIIRITDGQILNDNA